MKTILAIFCGLAIAIVSIPYLDENPNNAAYEVSFPRPLKNLRERLRNRKQHNKPQPPPKVEPQPQKPLELPPPNIEPQPQLDRPLVPTLPEKVEPKSVEPVPPPPLQNAPPPPKPQPKWYPGKHILGITNEFFQGFQR